MATRNEMEILAGKALAESGFRSNLHADPEAAAKSIGISLTSGQVEFLKNLDWDALDKLAQQAQAIFGDISKMAW